MAEREKIMTIPSADKDKEHPNLDALLLGMQNRIAVLKTSCQPLKTHTRGHVRARTRTHPM